ncbi:hypothetical protein Tco_0258568 [Tanacetum coccineum]
MVSETKSLPVWIAEAVETEEQKTSSIQQKNFISDSGSLIPQSPTHFDMENNLTLKQANDQGDKGQLEEGEMQPKVKKKLYFKVKVKFKKKLAPKFKNMYLLARYLFLVI